MTTPEYVSVPRRPTDAMLAVWLTPEERAGGQSGGDMAPWAAAMRKYDAMLTAAQPAPAVGGEPVAWWVQDEETTELYISETAARIRAAQLDCGTARVSPLYATPAAQAPKWCRGCAEAATGLCAKCAETEFPEQAPAEDVEQWARELLAAEIESTHPLIAKRLRMHAGWELRSFPSATQSKVHEIAAALRKPTSAGLGDALRKLADRWDAEAAMPAIGDPEGDRIRACGSDYASELRSILTGSASGGDGNDQVQP